VAIIRNDEKYFRACDRIKGDCVTDGKVLSRRSTTHQLNLQLARATEDKRWDLVSTVLELGGSEEQRASAFKIVATTADVQGLELTLPHCNTKETDLVLATARGAGRWDLVSEVLMLCGSAKQLTQTIDYAYNDVRLLCQSNLMAHCRLLECIRLLIKATRDWKWEIIGRVMKFSESTVQRQTILSEACNTCNNKNLGSLLLFCNTQELDFVLRRTTSLGKWEMTSRALWFGGSDGERVRTLFVAYWSADESDFSHLIPYCNKILSKCNPELLDYFLVNATRRGEWSKVREVLKVGEGEEQRVKTIEEALNTAEDMTLKTDLLPYCNRSELECILKTATQQKRWSSVAKMLRAGDTNPHVQEQCRWALSEVCRCWRYTTLMSDIETKLGASGVQLLANSLTLNQQQIHAKSVALRSYKKTTGKSLVKRVCHKCGSRFAESCFGQLWSRDSGELLSSGQTTRCILISVGGRCKRLTSTSSGALCCCWLTTG
jgi:hypothetical protein